MGKNNIEADKAAWAVIVGAFCIAFYSMFLRDNVSVNDYAFVAGEVLVYTFVAYAILRASFLKYYSPLVSYISFLSLFAGFMAGYAYRHETQKSEAVALIESMAGMQKTLAGEMYDADGLPKPIEHKFAENSSNISELRPLDVFMRKLMNTEVYLYNTYLAELNSLGLNDILAFSRITSEGGLEESLGQIPALRDAVIKHRDVYMSFYLGIPALASAGDLPEAQITSIQEGFNRAFPTKKPLFDEQWRYESEAINYVEKILLTLQKAEGGWVVVDEQLQFSDTEALERYNELQTALQATIAAQEEVVSQIRSYNENLLQDGINRINEM